MRKIETVFDLLAMLMVLFITVVPHHHHQALLCLVQEECIEDHCYNDEHTNHSDANHQEQESHCITSEKYCQDEDQYLAWPVLAPISVEVISTPNGDEFRTFPRYHHPAKSFSSIPILSWRINC